MSPTGKVTASSTHEAAEDPVVGSDGLVVLGECEAHPASPLTATTSTAPVTLSSNFVDMAKPR
ncbi:hypothetical protein [Mycobacterium sp. 852002-51163_SCH5372311]|uniref:hypothetical protein n=1 Tax=Mycobacterium sp. 852002-51163_SCH5372311 TaxID=1834097 RepID=UPI0012E8C651|nr:hypothetical protein [Mycobacterium sp. 852002-51163_SCH5372311]